MPHNFTFFRSGGFDQVLLATAADIAHLRELNQKLWAALSCPVKGVEFDERTLALIDTDHDGRVRVGEVLEAIDFAKARLTDLGAIIPGNERLPLKLIATSDAEGKAILACAKRLLVKALKPDAPDIGVADIATAAGDLANTDFNGDGIVPPDSLTDPTLSALAADIIAVTGGEKDRNGKVGVGETSLAAFNAVLAAHAAWRAKLTSDPSLLPASEAIVATASAAVQAVRAKVDDFFARCRLCAYDSRAEVALNRSEADFLALAAKDLVVEHSEIAAFPLARIAPHKALPLGAGINPAWITKLAALRRDAIAPLLGDREALDETGWNTLCAQLDSYLAWSAARPAGTLTTLGEPRIAAIIANPSALSALATAIVTDKDVAPEFAALISVERLIRLHRDLYRLLHNFVNFADFYSPDRLAVFQAGTLYLDNRSFELCIRVEDAGRHAALAGLAKSYLAYCDCTRAGSADKLTICVAVTNGDSDYLMVGRNGVFYDRKGNDWDATITKIIDNPISIREAFWSPYKKAIRFVEDLVAKRAAAADEAANAKLQQAASEAVTKAATAAQTAQAGKKADPPPKPKFDVGTIAALGVGVGAIGGIVGGFVSGFIGLGWWMPLGLIGLLLAISLPSMIIAALKLRLRNLGPILDANGWAVNGRVKINIPFGTALSSLAVLPSGSKRMLTDPYAEKKKPWKTYVALAVLFGLLAWIGIDRLWSKHWLWSELPDGRYRIEQILHISGSAKAAEGASSATQAASPAPAK